MASIPLRNTTGTPDRALPPSTVSRPAARVLGLTLQTDGSTESDPGQAVTHGLWMEVRRRLPERLVDEAIDGSLWSVRHGYHAPQAGCFRVTVGVPLAIDAPRPELSRMGLDLVPVPAALGLEFHLGGGSWQEDRQSMWNEIDEWFQDPDRDGPWVRTWAWEVARVPLIRGVLDVGPLGQGVYFHVPTITRD